LLIILLLQNYRSYCIKTYISEIDTVQVIQYRGQFGLFADSAASVKITRKVMLADSLAKINFINEQIIKRNELQRGNSIAIENNFKQYQKNEIIVKKLMVKSFNLAINKKNLEIWGYRIGIGAYIIIKYVVPLLKP